MIRVHRRDGWREGGREGGRVGEVYTHHEILDPPLQPSELFKTF